jgi:hypothetical protein
MPAPSVYLDECVNHGLVEPLRKRGFDVTTAQAEGIVGVDDESQLSHAARRGLAILSHNKRHFQHWHRIFAEQGRSHGGIILLPSSRLSLLELRAAMMLDWIGTHGDAGSRLFLWGDLQRELARGLALAGYSRADVRSALGRA